MKKSILKKVRKNLGKNGFTLIEVIAVVVIIAILISITVPSVREFISGGRRVAYKSYIKNMEVAAQSYITDCVQNNEKNCGLPDVGESTVISLNDLIEMGFSDRLKDPEDVGYCQESTSYVTISNKGTSVVDIDYEACLYCSNYQTDSPTCIRYTGEGSAPICGTINGSSNTWTNSNRTVSVGCQRADDEPSSECVKSEFSKTFISSTNIGTIRISTAGGKTTDCDVDVKVDKDIPTCTLRVKEGAVKQNGWYGENTIIEMDSQTDTGGSGLLTYGIGTSLNTRDYNKNTEISIGNGVTTIFGYVMDKAGNEGYKSIQVMADTTKPVISRVLQGYQVYPNKENYTLSGINLNGIIHTTTNNDPQINITGLTNYKQVSRVVVWFSNPLVSGMNTQAFYKTVGNNYSEANSIRRTIGSGESSVSFDIPKNTYDGIRLDLGDATGLTYSISRIELIVEDTTDLYTNKDVRLYVEGTDTITGIDKYSYDNGATWVDDTNKLYGTNQDITVKLIDGAGNISDPATISLNNIDKTSPSCTLTASGSITNGWYTSNAVVSFGTAVDGAETSQYVMSGVNRNGIGSITGGTSTTHTADTNSTGVTYTGYIEDRAGNVNTCTLNVKKDSTIPTITFNPNGNAVSEVSQTTAVTHSDGTGSGVATSQYAWSTSNSVQPTFTNNYTNGQDLTITTINSANYYLWIKVVDNAGNTRIATSNAFNVSAPRYYIAYNANGGSGTMSNTTCTMNTPCALSANNFSRNNYEFLGWSTDSGATTPTYPNLASVTNLTTTPNETVNLFAVWRSLAYVVTYDVNGGTGVINSATCYEGSTCVLSSTIPTKTGYTFIGWNTLQNGTGTTYTSGQSVAPNLSTGGTVITLYAKYTANTYTIVFNPNGGTGTTASKVCTYDQACVLTTNGFTRFGFAFDKWNTASNGSGTSYANNASVINLSAIQGATINLYAQWIDLAYVVTYDVNGGTGVVNSTVCYEGSACVLSSTTPTKTGYIFTAWNTAANGSGTAYTSGQVVPPNLATAGSVVILYAQYPTPITYTIAFNANGGTGTTASKVCTYNLACTLTANGFSKTGYLFANWNTLANGTGTTYTNNQSVTNLTATNGATITLYAQYPTPITYTIAFNANGGTGTTASKGCTYGQACVLTSNGFTRTGYTFSGWATSAGGSVVYTNGASVTNLTATNGATVTLYAKWTPITCTIAFNANGGTGTTASVACTYDVAVNLTANGFSRTGYTFAGWATSAGGAVVYTNGQSVTNLCSGQGATTTLYAKWTANTYTIAFNINTGTSGTTASKACTYDVACVLTSNGFAKTNYTFANWNTVAGGTGTAYTNGQSVTNLTATNGATVTLYAQWTAKTYTITYNAGTGTGAPATQTYYGNDSLVLTSTTPTLAGYLFFGWATSTPSITPAYQPGNTVSGGSLTLYAIYAQETFTMSINEGTAFQCQGGATNQYDFYNYLNTVDPITGVWRLTGHLTSTISNAKGKTYYRCFNFVANQYGALYGCERAGTSSADYCSCPGRVTGYSTSYKSTPSTCTSGSGGLKVTATFKYAESIPSGTVFTN